MKSTGNNFGIDKQFVFGQELLWSNHPVLMFNRAILDVFQTIKCAIRKEKLYAKVIMNTIKTYNIYLAISKYHDVLH